MLPLLLALHPTPCLAAPDAATVAGMPASSASARLDRLIAAVDLDEAGLRALAASDPVLVHQLRDRTARAALRYLLSLPPAEIRKVRDGLPVIRVSWDDAEEQRLATLCLEAGVKLRRVRAVHVHTPDAQMVKVDLEMGRETMTVALAYPPELAPADAVASVRAWLGEGADGARRPPTDPGFEDAASLGMVWLLEGPREATARRDTARHAVGASSVQVDPASGTARLSQALDLRPGDVVEGGVQAFVEGADARARLVFLDAAGAPLADEGDEDRARPDGIGWQALRFGAVAPPDTAGARIELVAKFGIASFDDVRVAVVDRHPAPMDTWASATSGTVTVRADPVKVASPGEIAERVDRALRGGIVRVSITATEPVTVYAFVDDAHRLAFARSTTRGAAAGGEDPSAGICWGTADSPWIAACPLGVALRRAWGAPGNALLREGLPRAIAGAGVDLDAEARSQVARYPSLTTLATSWTGSDGEVAVATSFTAWLLRTQGQAAVHAAWRAASLAELDVAGQDLAALENAWRKEVGSGG